LWHERVQPARIPSPEIDGDHKRNEQGQTGNGVQLNAEACHRELWTMKSHRSYLSIKPSYLDSEISMGLNEVNVSIHRALFQI
jgi:hypothetical protein